MAFNECSPVYESLEIDQWPAGVNRSAVRNRNGFAGKELHVSFRICLNPHFRKLAVPAPCFSSRWSGPLPLGTMDPPMTVLNRHRAANLNAIFRKGPNCGDRLSAKASNRLWLRAACRSGRISQLWHRPDSMFLRGIEFRGQNSSWREAQRSASGIPDEDVAGSEP